MTPCSRSTAIRRSSGIALGLQVRRVDDGQLGLVHVVVGIEVELLLHPRDVRVRGLDVEARRRAEARVVPDVAVDHDHLLLGDVGVLRLGPLEAFLARDRLVLAVGLVGDDEGRALRAFTTSVCTLRFPYSVGRALGICAASSLTSSGVGFSITLPAFGSRNNIFATCSFSLSGTATASLTAAKRGNSYERPIGFVRVRSIPGGSDTRRARRRRGVRRDARRDRGSRSRRRRRASLEDPSGPQPLRRGRGRDQRGARKRVRGQPGGARVRHGQGLRLPGRPGRDPDPLRRGARRRLPARALGRGLLAHRGRADRAAAVRSRRRAENGVCGGHHRPRARPRPLRAGDEARHPDLRGVLRLEARDRRRPLPGRDRLGPPERRAEDDRRQDGHPLHRRRGPALHGHDERLRLHGRRNGHGPSGGGAAEGHGDDAVPPDDAGAVRCSDHRGLPRRGRVPPERATTSASSRTTRRTPWSSPVAT